MIDLREYVNTRKGARQFAEVKRIYPEFDLGISSNDMLLLKMVEETDDLVNSYAICKAGRKKIKEYDLLSDVKRVLDMKPTLEEQDVLKQILHTRDAIKYLMAVQIKRKDIDAYNRFMNSHFLCMCMASGEFNPVYKAFDFVNYVYDCVNDYYSSTPSDITGKTYGKVIEDMERIGNKASKKLNSYNNKISNRFLKFIRKLFRR